MTDYGDPELYPFDPEMKGQCRFIIWWQQCRLDHGHDGMHSPGRLPAHATPQERPHDNHDGCNPYDPAHIAGKSLASQERPQPVPASVLMQVKCEACSHIREGHPDGAECLGCGCHEFEWPDRVPVASQERPSIDVERLARQELADAWGITRTGEHLHRLHSRYDYTWRGHRLIGGACCGVALTELANDLVLSGDEPRCPRCLASSHSHAEPVALTSVGGTE